jgi:hypothetical protein
MRSVNVAKRDKMIRKFLVPGDPWVDSYAKVAVSYAEKDTTRPWGWQDDITVVLADCDRKVTLDFSFTRGNKKEIATMRKKLERIYEVLNVVHDHLDEAENFCSMDAQAYKEAKTKYEADKKDKDYV